MPAAPFGSPRKVARSHCCSRPPSDGSPPQRLRTPDVLAAAARCRSGAPPICNLSPSRSPEAISKSSGSSRGSTAPAVSLIPTRLTLWPSARTERSPCASASAYRHRQRGSVRGSNRQATRRDRGRRRIGLPTHSDALTVKVCHPCCRDRQGHADGGVEVGGEPRR
jgi:hypothetical protein